MKITFTTKEESNLNRQQDFLALSPDQRFWRFVDLCRSLKMFATKAQHKNSDNFIIKLYKEDD
jgi:hypothetical protein